MRMLAELLWTGLWVCLPLLGLTLLTGILISIVQVVTQIQEASLAFIPKLIVATVVLVALGPWMLSKLVQFTTRLWTGIPGVI
jgi:flagellar biosynthetic protein FliQ